MKNKDLFTVTVGDISNDGQGIGRTDDGAVFFIPGALPGEVVKATLTRQCKNHALGELVEIVQHSPLRVTPPCHVFGKCGGCTLQHLSYAGQLEYKQKRVRDCISRIGGLDCDVLFPLPSQQQYHYRNKAAFPVKPQNGGVDIGLYAYRTHDVIDISDCIIQRPEIAIVMSQLRVWIAKRGVTAYDEATGEGLLRHVVLRTGLSGEIMLILVINGEDIPAADFLISLFKMALPQVRSIILNHNTQKTNVIMGDRNTVIMGRDFYFETIDGLEFKVGPGNFLQVNSTQTTALYNNLLKQAEIGPDDRVVDLFCGIGTISLLAARRAKHVTGGEISAQSIENARFNADLNGIENIDFYAGDAGAVLETLPDADIIIIDPPRKGLDQPLVQAIANRSPKKIVYVSCDPATFARDLKAFAALGYLSGTVQPIDMFPQTTHTEVIAVLKRQ